MLVMTKRNGKKIKLNKGLIVGQLDKKEILVKFKVLKNRLQFNFGNTVMKTYIDKEDKCIGKFDRINKLEEAMCGELYFPGFKDVLKYLVESRSIKFESAIFMIDGYVYSLVVIQNGFLLHMEIMPGMIISFGVLHQGGNILLAYQEGEWDLKSHNQDIIEICEDYFHALKVVLAKTDNVYLTIIKDYNNKFLIN